jgi:DNA-directed RNA polymerase specialized sigma24 family protein
MGGRLGSGRELAGLSSLNGFTLDTNIQAWLFSILHNQFHTPYWESRREVEDQVAFIPPSSPRSVPSPAALRIG